MKILTVNPGSTSTKVALFDGEKEVWSDTKRYDVDVLGNFNGIMAQEEFRLESIKKMIRDNGTSLEELDAVVGRGGLLNPIPGGTYEVNETMLEDVRSCKYGEHASNLGAPLALSLASEGGCGKAFIVDPVVVDELLPEARLSGLAEIERRSIWHALNQKAVARRAALELGRKYEDVNLIVAHMGGGISVGAHEKGRAVDVNNALDGEGPFSPERAGSLPAGGLCRLAYSGEYDLDELRRKMVGGAGLVAHLGTNDLREVQKMIEAGNEKAKLIFDALALQVAKEIGSRAAVLYGEVDAIVLTGGLAYSEKLVEQISEKVAYISQIKVYPGEDEMKALADGGIRVLEGEEQVLVYEG